MPIPDKDLVQQTLARDDRNLLCRQAVENGWMALREKQPDVAWWRRKATAANVMWENTVDNAIAAFTGMRGVKHVPHYDTASFLFDDTVLARFKLANVGLITSNFPTPLAELFHRHDHDLFGFHGYHRVEIVHVLNRFRTAVDWVGVVAREGRKVIWQFELPAGGAVIETLPLAPKPMPAADRVLRPVKHENEKDVEKESE